MCNRVSRRVVLGALALWPWRAAAIGLPDPAIPVAFTPREVTDDGHLVADDGVVILAGLAPEGGVLREALAARLGRRFGRVGDAPDRYRRTRAQVLVDDEWLQAALVSAGLARVGVDAAARRFLRDLLRLENEARVGRRGAWGDGRFRVLDAGALGFVPAGFHVLEGAIERVAQERAASTITLASTTQRALRVSVAAALRAEFRRVGVAPDGWVGRRLRVRGHVAWRGGLMIEAAIPEQFEFDP